MLALLALELNQQCGYGKLAFPRLVTGEIVIRPDIAPLDPDHAREQMAAVLADHCRVKGVLENSIRAILRGALTPVLAQGPTAGTHAAGTHGNYDAKELLGPFADKRHGRADFLERGKEWWGHQDRRLGNDPIDELINLRTDAERARAHRQADAAGRRNESADSRRMITRRLWAALLADLRDSFSDRRAINWTRNCVLLLDNADTPAARAFLEELVSVRKDRERDEPDPLTVVATSRGSLTSRVSTAAPASLYEAGRAHYGERTGTGGSGGSGAWWYPILLPPLNWSQTATMVDALRLPGAHAEAVTAAVHGFTCGHPAATSTLLAAIAANPGSLAEMNPSALLASKDLTKDVEHERTVEDALLDRLLMPSLTRDQAAADDLATCAAARHKEVTLRLATDSRLLEQLPGELTSVFSSGYWAVDPASGRSVLHPLLRRLLLRRLADREADAKASWARVHLWLRWRALRDGYPDTALYHTLALAGTDQDELAALLRRTVAEDRAGHRADEQSGAHERPDAPVRAVLPREADPLEFELPLEHVARQLADSLKSDATTWLRRVAWITSSPTRLDLARKPRDQTVMLTGWVDKREEPLAPVARYVAYCWLGADPLSAPHWGWLLSQMAGELDLISRYSDDGGLSVLRAEAERYRNLADGSWRDIEDFWMKRMESADDREPSQGEVHGN
ncbi:MAG TPA: hypothetical protein VN969_47955 [Streptosporangiaceae bacterium]|nr:hypothetical protein [Streptosporangiaceae bacterium]